MTLETTTHCECPGCRALNERYATDPRLLAFYRKKLLIRGWAGWAGTTDSVERAYIKAHARWAQALMVASAGTRFRASNCGDDGAVPVGVALDDHQA